MTLGDLASGASMDSLHNSPLVYLMGPTCSGKGTFINFLRQYVQNPMGFVEVGKLFRQKYPPSYFQGQMNPQHTRTEALVMYTTEVRRCLAEEAETIFIDGQPRNGQVELILDSFPEHPKVFLYFYAPEEVRMRRALGRDQDEESRKLSIERVRNDMIGYHEVLCALLEKGQMIHVVNTDTPVEQWTERALDLLTEATR